MSPTTQYLRCVKNDTYFADDLADGFVDLQIGQIYKQLPLYEEERGSGMVRVIDDSGDSYLYPASYFESVDLSAAIQPDRSAAITLRLNPLLKGMLHAEAVAARKSVNALLREWIDERLDLPAQT